MLNLSQIQTQVKSTPAPRLNPAHPLAVNDAYRQLKALGWTCVNSEIHPVDRVPVFRLGSAAVRRDKDNPGGWIVTVSDLEYRFTGEVNEISRFVSEITPQPAQIANTVSESEPTPAPVSSTMAEAQGLMSEYPELTERITRALALVEADQTEFPRYNTRFDPAGFYGYRDCDCGDASHRQPRAKFGIACKHTLAQEIAARVKRTAWRVANQKLASDSERRAAALARNDYASPASYRPAADPLNVKVQRPVYQFGKHVVR